MEMEMELEFQPILFGVIFFSQWTGSSWTGLSRMAPDSMEFTRLRDCWYQNG